MPIKILSTVGPATDQKKNISKLLKFSDILRTNGTIEGSRRVAYPFSNYHISDAHVLSSYTGFTFIAYQEYIRKVLNHKNIHSLIS